MANNLKKLLSLLIALVMVFSMIPAVSAAESDATTDEPAATEPAAPAYPTPSAAYEADQWTRSKLQRISSLIWLEMQPEAKRASMLRPIRARPLALS